MAIRIRSILVAALAAFFVAGLATSASALILIKIPGVHGDTTYDRYDGYFVADSFSFGVEREMKEGAEDARSDLNIGIGELQECTVSKSIDGRSAPLAEFVMQGGDLADVEILVIQFDDGGEPYTYLKYKLDRVWIKSWSTSGDADDRPTEEVSFYYNKIAMGYAFVNDQRR